MKYSNLLNEKIIWNLNCPGYKIFVNDIVGHELEVRIENRTNLTPEDVNNKIQHGLNKIITFIEYNKIPEKTICLNYIYSKFKVIVKIVNKTFIPDSKSTIKKIYIKTILGKGMHATNTFDLNIEESKEILEMEIFE